MPDVLWGTDVEVSDYAGHRGLQYSPRPTTFASIFAESQRWADRTFLVHGARRMTFAAFADAVSTESPPCVTRNRSHWQARRCSTSVGCRTC